MSSESSGEERGEIFVHGPSSFNDLPEDCISHIISFTSPRDACVAASVSKTFASAVHSDSVWEKFLPPEYLSLVPQSQVSLSKKELYFTLCHDPLLIEDGKKSFWLEKTSGKRCIMLSPNEMWITWVSSPQYFWRWISIPEARFEGVPELLNVCWFEVRGRISTRYLSPMTRYSVYIVFKTKNGCPGLGDVPVEVEVGLMGQESSQRLIYFVGPSDQRTEREMRDVMKPEKREDGWMEVELGEFFNETSCDEISATVLENKSPRWKRGLIIQGFEFRPAKSP
ncbi:PREDICTED: putative F-box protein PP2-B2 [Camelina sativa]|uniref:F-box protein PP2-B2 n=1 Tax=Camelina sativa TaxID=90675 RepID=A0ABM1QGT6_CAMSA|nr:PREDICTED: putative F-box protein PP2-B2 [Camelina sativa]